MVLTNSGITKAEWSLHARHRLVRRETDGFCYQISSEFSTACSVLFKITFEPGEACMKHQTQSVLLSYMPFWYRDNVLESCFLLYRRVKMLFEGYYRGQKVRTHHPYQLIHLCTFDLEEIHQTCDKHEAVESIQIAHCQSGWLSTHRWQTCTDVSPCTLRKRKYWNKMGNSVKSALRKQLRNNERWRADVLQASVRIESDFLLTKRSCVTEQTIDLFCR